MSKKALYKGPKSATEIFGLKMTPPPPQKKSSVLLAWLVPKSNYVYKLKHSRLFLGYAICLAIKCENFKLMTGTLECFQWLKIVIKKLTIQKTRLVVE